MPGGLYRGDPLSSAQREEFEEDLISFCDRALGLLGDISSLDVLYAGGAAPLWLEGLAGRIGAAGSLTALEIDARKIDEARQWLAGVEPECPVRIVAGDVFFPPFTQGSFDLVYSAGLLHELDVDRHPAREAISALATVLRSGGRLATDDFVDSVPAAQLEDEALEDGLRRTLGEEPYGIGPPERLVALHEGELELVVARELEPYGLRHLDRLFLAGEPEDHAGPREAATETLWRRWLALRERVRREGYTRPATLYVEGWRPGRSGESGSV